MGHTQLMIVAYYLFAGNTVQGLKLLTKLMATQSQLVVLKVLTAPGQKGIRRNWYYKDSIARKSK
jgi:hypothetical protein